MNHRFSATFKRPVSPRGSRRRTGIGLALGLLALAACSERSAETQGDPDYDRWIAQRGHKLSPTVLRLRDGSCLDLSRLPKPWSPVPYSRNALRIAAAPQDVEITPGRPALPGWGDDDSDGRVYALIGGWSKPWKDWGTWQLGPPETFNERMSRAGSRRVDKWPGEDLEAWRWSDGHRWVGFVDKRRYTQCRIYGPDEPFICNVVSKDEIHSYAIKLDPSNILDLPTRLARVTAAVEATRGECPA